MKNLYLKIKERIALRVPEIKHSGLSNDQFNKEEEGKERGYAWPVVWISFPDQVQYLPMAGGVQKGECLIRLYIGIRSVKDEILEIFDLKDKIFTALQNYQQPGFDPLVRVGEQTDEDHPNWYIFKQDYKTTIKDTTLYINKNRTPFLAALEIIPSLDIDNETIRTGDGIE